LDRYGEVDVIADKWKTALLDMPKSTKLLVNADDPQLALIGKHFPQNARYFGLDNPKLYLSKMQHATDSTYCPKCGKKLHFQGVYFSHLGDWDCLACGFHKPTLILTDADVTSPLEGIYNIYNTLAATLTTQLVGLKARDIQKSLQQFVPAFGRMEEVSYQGKTWKILLSKNPTGCNESIRTVLHSNQKGPLLIVLNDRIPDGTDVSWIWDVDFSQLNSFKNDLILSGDRGEDLNLCLKYSINTYKENEDKNLICLKKQLHDAVDTVAQRARKDETIWVLATYSAMLDVRKILTGRKIL
jgi:UDP-N-acetylmuramyl tripeptide synthase